MLIVGLLTTVILCKKPMICVLVSDLIAQYMHLDMGFDNGLSGCRVPAILIWDLIMGFQDEGFLLS